MSKTRVLITVTTYPLPSRSYDELICTAGILPSGEWIRIYPVPLSFLDYKKYQWVELELIEHEPRHDFRPESRRPKQPDLSDLEIVRHIDTAQNWYERKEACLQHVYTNMTALIEDSKAPANVSLAAFKPSAFRRFIVEDDDREWKEQWLEQLKQVDMFTGGSATSETRAPIDKIPYKFKYQFEDDEGRSSKMTIEDWEIGALYRNCLAAAKGDEHVAIDKVRQRYETDFFNNNDLTLFLGTTLEHHRKRHSNPFTIIGVFYPKRDLQASLI